MATKTKKDKTEKVEKEEKAAPAPKAKLFDEEVLEKVVQLRNDGAKWEEIANQLEIPQGYAILYFQVATCPKKDQIKNATAADVVRLRDEENLSWGNIVARTRLPESRLRSMYEEATGNSTRGNRIGKGGRYPDDAERPEPKEKAPKEKKEKAPKAPKRSEKAQALDDMDLDGLKEALTGRTIKVSTGEGDDETITVRTVKATKNGSVNLIDDETGRARALKISSIVAIKKAAA